MGDFGNRASRFTLNTKSLDGFDEGLRIARQKKTLSMDRESVVALRKLLNVMNPIIESLKGRLSESLVVSEGDLVEILRTRHNRDWPGYKEKIEGLYSKLVSAEVSLTEGDLLLLDDIADALDAECAGLFRRMNER